MKLKPKSLDEIFRLKGGGDHSLFSPSASKMWLTCSGSLIPNILAPNESNEHSAYGTVAHEVSEVWLQSGKKPRHMIGQQRFIENDDWGFLIKIDEQMIDYVQESVDRFILLPGDHLVEQRVYFDRLTPIPRQGGTLDFAALQPGYAVVGDHKYGVEVVYAERNTQLMLYALGLLYAHDAQYDFRRFRLMINQPRANHFDEWEVSRDELMEFAGYVRERAKAAWDFDAPRTPSPEACRWCRVRQSCAANALMEFRLMEEATEAAFRPVTAGEIDTFKSEIDDEITGLQVNPVDPKSLTIEQLAKLRPYKAMAERWWNAVHDELQRRALAKEDIPGHKLVEGRSFRMFAKPEAAATHLIKLGCKPGDVRYTEIVSPAQAEELLIKAGHRRKDLEELLAGLVKRPPGKPTLVPLSDPRTALVDLSMGVFSDLTEKPETTENEEL